MSERHKRKEKLARETNRAKEAKRQAEREKGEAEEAKRRLEREKALLELMQTIAATASPAALPCTRS